MTEKSLISICPWCKKIRTEDMSRKSIDMYLADIGFGVFTHGMCPDCAEKYFLDALSGKAVSIYDIQSDPDAAYRKQAEKEGIRSILSIIA